MHVQPHRLRLDREVCGGLAEIELGVVGSEEVVVRACGELADRDDDRARPLGPTLVALSQQAEDPVVRLGATHTDEERPRLRVARRR